MKKIYFLFVIVFVQLLCSCGQNNSQRVFKKYLEETKKSSETGVIRNQLRDSMVEWIDKGLYYVLFFCKARWKVDDVVFFDKLKRKALLFILIQSNDPKIPEDYVKAIGAEKIDGVWIFYYASYFTQTFSRNGLHGKANEFEFMAEKVHGDIVEDGFIKCSLGCKVDFDYIDSDIWFAQWRRDMHKGFLENTLPAMPGEEPGKRPL